MKKFSIILVVLCGAVACAMIYLNETKTSGPVAGPVVNSTPEPSASAAAPEDVSASKRETPPPAPVATAAAPVATPAPVAVSAQADDSANPIHKAVDDLLSATNALDKHNLFQQLVKSGQIGAAIAELKQRMAGNPNDAEIPTTLGEAQLNEVRAIKEGGGDVDQMGILAMQADQSFNAALKIDPENYEAQLVKAISQTFWPADPARDGQVVQTLSSLIDRQTTMPSQPDFAQTYVYLGNEYQKIGQPEKALATWQLGLQQFPNDPTLQQKVNGP